MENRIQEVMKKVKKNVLIRCDSSILIGTGHARRSFYLAKELKENSFNVIFFCRNHEGNTNYIFKKDNLPPKKVIVHNFISFPFSNYITI